MHAEHAQDALIERLVAIHGEEGVAPSRTDWKAILSMDAQAPVFILNLLRFKGGGEEGGGKSGREAYADYTTHVAEAFQRAGGKALFFGDVEHVFPAMSSEGWDAAVLTRYPTPRALADMWLDPAFVDAHAHRGQGVDRSLVVVMNDPRRKAS